MANALAITLHAVASENASGQGDAVDIGAGRSCVKLRLVIDELTGTDPAIDVGLETADTDTGPWVPVPDPFSQVTEPGAQELAFAPCRRYVRATWTIADAEGTTGPVVQTGTGPAITVTGEPATSDPGNVTITLGGTRGTATFDWSACGESGSATTAATVVLGTTGLTVAFPLGTYVLADEYDWTCTPDPNDAVVSFALAGEAHQLYAEPADIANTSLPAEVVAASSPSVLAACCLRATDDAANKLADVCELPLVSWDAAFRGAVADIAGFYAMKHRGFDPTQGPDALIRTGFTDAMAWLKRIADKKEKPPVVDSTTTVYEGATVVVTKASRGW